MQHLNELEYVDGEILANVWYQVSAVFILKHTREAVVMHRIGNCAALDIVKNTRAL